MAHSIVFMGTPQFAVPSLQAILDAGFEVKGVFTQPDRAVGRGQKLAFSPVKEVALEHDIPVFQPEKLRGNEEALVILQELKPDAIAVVAYGQMIPNSILELPPFYCINVHGSLLPKYRGAAPIQWAIARGETTTGITTMLIGEKMDAGPILLQRECQIFPEDTSETLFPRLSALGGVLLVETLHGVFAGTLTPIPQKEEEATYAPMIKKEEGLIRWEMPAREISNRIRAFTPWPGSSTTLDGKPVKVIRAVPLEGSGGAPGEVLSCNEDGWRVSTGEGILLIEDIQIPGKCCQPACVAARGLRCLEPGLVLGS